MKALESILVGAACAAALTAWVLVGYLIQRFLLRNPKPGGATIVLTAMVATMVIFALVSFWGGYWHSSN